MVNFNQIKQLQKIKRYLLQCRTKHPYFLKSILRFLPQKTSFKVILLYASLATLGLFFVLGVSIFFLIQDLPSLAQLKHYHPPLVSSVVDRNGETVGEFFRERRMLVPYAHFPENLIQAFVSAEDGQFFIHKGLHYQAIFRAFLANLKKGRKVQGGSTITQQVARSVLLSSEKTYRRKLKEAVLALRIEKALSKEEILYLYLNQIYLGHGAYGVGMAAKVYFRKEVKDLNLAECALLAGLPKAPSRFSPIRNSARARQRQLYVLQRMVEESHLSSQAAQQAAGESVKIYLKERARKTHPYYMEILRQILSEKLGEEQLLTGGLKIQAALDHNMQTLAQKHLKAGLKELDKRQGFRGPLKHLNTEEDIAVFFQKEEKTLIRKHKQFIFVGPNEDSSKQTALTQKHLDNSDLSVGSLVNKNSLENKMIAFDGGDEARAVVRKVSDSDKQVLVELAFKQFGIIPLENMKWARQPNPKISSKYANLLKPSLALKQGDVIQVKVKNLEYSDAALTMPTDQNLSSNSKKLLELSLDQEPLVEGAILVFDQKTADITALVGGYHFARSQFNRAYQAARQTGSVFKPIVYLAALDKGLTPADLITDEPVVYAKTEAAEEAAEEAAVEIIKKVIKDKNLHPSPDSLVDEESQDSADQKWKPFNYSRRFSGDILFRNALIRSMNVPTVKVIEKIGIKWVRSYARRLGLFHPLNPDYTLALGSSSVTLYEMTKAFSVIGRLGKKIRPRILKGVSLGQESLLDSMSLDSRFANQLQVLEQEMEEKRQKFLDKIDSEDASSSASPGGISFFFTDPDQLVSRKTAFILTTLLNAAIQEPGGTGYRARSLHRAAAGKTGTTNGYYDAWFIGYTPHLIAGVWVGFDNEKSLGIGETGSRAALPIWLNFMKEVYATDLIDEKQDFEVPGGIVFANIDNETGQLVSSRSKKVVNQAFIEGTQPTESDEYTDIQEDQDFLRGDLSE